MTGHEGLRTRAARLAVAAAQLKSASLAAGGGAAPFALAFMSDPRGPDAELVARAAPAGAAIILRDYDDPRREARARRLQSICARRGLFVLIGADAGLARAVSAAGVHWPSWAPARARASAAARGLLQTSACHDADELARAGALRMDAAFLSPAFPTPSHPKATALRPARFRALARGAGLPVLALGGVDERNAPLLAGANVAGLAAVGAFAPRRAPQNENRRTPQSDHMVSNRNDPHAFRKEMGRS